MLCLDSKEKRIGGAKKMTMNITNKTDLNGIKGEIIRLRLQAQNAYARNKLCKAGSREFYQTMQEVRACNDALESLKNVFG